MTRVHTLYTCTCVVTTGSPSNDSSRSREVVVGVASSLGAFIFASLLFLTIGLACGCYWRHKWKRLENKSTENQTGHPAQTDHDKIVQEQQLELKENVAYYTVTSFQ